MRSVWCGGCVQGCVWAPARRAAVRSVWCGGCVQGCVGTSEEGGRALGANNAEALAALREDVDPEGILLTPGSQYLYSSTAALKGALGP